MGKSYRQSVSKWDKPSKNDRASSMRREQEMREKALRRSLKTMKGMTRSD